MKDRVEVEVGTCENCDKFPVCSIVNEKKRVATILNGIESINHSETPFRVSLNCNFFRNIFKAGGYR